MVFSPGRRPHSQDVSDNSIFLNLMIADLILALGLCIPGHFFIQNSDIVSVASRRFAHDQLDG